MAVTAYASTDSSAPVLTGETGKLNDLLDAILVNGYGSKAAAGWSKPYSDATSKTAVFRPAAGPQHYFQIQDNGPSTATFKEARIRGYVAMSAYNTGTEPFPTAAQLVNGCCIRKSVTADTAARAWRAFADARTLWLMIITGDTAGDYFWYGFGAFRSWKASDAYASFLAARTVENTFSHSQSQDALFACQITPAAVGLIYLPRSYTGLGTSVLAGTVFNAATSNQSFQAPYGTTGLTYPNPVDGGIILSPIWLNELNIVRGQMPGLWMPGHGRPILHDDTFTASDGAVTRTFQACNMGPSGQAMIETSDTWYND